MKPLFSSSFAGFSLLFYLVHILFSCAGKMTTNQNLDYNDTVNRQFWTADWSPDDKFIAVGGVDSLLRIYHAEDLRLYKSFPINSWIHMVKWHPDGKTLAVATLKNYVHLLNPESGNMVKLNSVGGSRALGWNHNGQLLAVADLEGLIKIWNKQGVLMSTIDKNYGPEVVGESYLSLDWHPFKNIIVASNFQINLFDTTGRELKVMEHKNKAAIILCTKWHPSGKFFVIGDYGYNWDGENVPSLLHFWTEEGNLIKSVSGSKGEYRNISWNKEGTLLATASDVLRIWTSSGSLLHQSNSDSTNYLWGIDWSGKSDKIVTASRFKTIALWDNRAKLVKRIDVKKTP